MRQTILALLTGFFPLFLSAQTAGPVLPYVQPLVGTANSTTISATRHGEGTEQLANTIPAVGVPFGMTQWTPQTRTTEKKCLAPYYYGDQKLSGFRGTHWLSGSCTQDYGSLTIMPVSGRLKIKPEDYAAAYDHNDEVSAPDYYSVQLPEYKVKAEFTALARSGFFRFTVDTDDSLYLLVMPNSDQEKGYVKINRAKREIVAYNPAHRIYQGWGKPAGFSGYFVIQADQDFITSGAFANGTLLQRDSAVNVKDAGAYIGFRLKKGQQVKLRIGTSFTSIDAARKNLEAEVPGWDFNQVRKQSARAWEDQLSKIMVKTADARQKRIFYTALYHSMQHPRLFNDADGTYPKFSQQYTTGKIGQGGYYDDFSMWDIYRAQLPLMEILDPALTNSFAASLVLKGKQGGWLPIFPCWNSFTGAMVGDHSTAFLASAIVKGIKNFDLAEAYRLMRQNAFAVPPTEEYLDGKGRRALPSYLKYGFIPMEDSVPDAFHKKEQVSRTLEYAFDDYALSVVAKSMGKGDDHALLQKRAKNYRFVFDTSAGLVRGRYADGSWYAPFDPDKKLPFITEGTSRQYSFYVPQDIPGLAGLMGGVKGFENALDSLFLKGEYWHGNEPGHQIPFLYNYTASPWKTQLEVRKILLEEYSDGPGGLSGNDDAGQMSAWYVFAAMGFYPVNPVSNEYLLSAPLFEQIVLSLPGGKKLEIKTVKKTSASMYIRSVKFNGVPYTKNFILHEHLVRGGKFEIALEDQPVKEWGSQKAS
jgi:predicted alpha-1,2-mannosidase